MKRIRTFVCIEIEDELRMKMSQVSAKLSAAGAEVKWVAEKNLHLTLKFLGGVDETVIPEVSAAVGEVAGRVEPFDVTLASVGAFPEGGSPRVVWCGLQEPTGRLEKLYYALNKALRPYAEKEEHRKFSPHITLGRARSPRRREELKQLVKDNRDTEIGPQSVDTITVMMSELTPKGPIYTPLSKSPLGRKSENR